MQGLPSLPQGLKPAAAEPNAEEQAQQREAEEAARRDAMATILDNAARERRECLRSSPSLIPSSLMVYTTTRPVSRIGLVSPERSRQIESILVRMAQTGQLRGKVSETQLIELLEQVGTSACAVILTVS